MADNEKPTTRVRSVLEDPSTQAIARVYAVAFLDAAGNEAEGTLEELSSFLEDVLPAFPEFRTILLSAMVSRDEMVELIGRVLPGHCSETIANFMGVLAQHGRMEILPVIAEEARREHEKRSGKQRVQITSARPLSDERRQSISQTLSTQFEFEPILEEQVDPAIIGGLVIQIGTMVYDSSVKTQVKQLSGRLRQRSLHEIQRGRDRFSHPEGD